MEKNGFPLHYWLHWRVLVCSLIFLVPAVVAAILIRRRLKANLNPLKSTNLWFPCWRYLHPRWLLLYRAVAFLSMVFFLYQVVLAFGFFVFFFYTQWTFALVTIYFALATFVSARGCWTNSKYIPAHSGERAKFIKKDSDGNTEEEYESFTRSPLIEERAGFLENLMHNIYQTCAGAVMLTDIVFWCLLLPFMTGDHFKLTLLIGIMHSVNAVFLILDSALNSLPFSWFGIVYFVLWSCTYVVFHWALHACCFQWWPYPFLDLSTPWAPMWYFALALVHIPCYGLYVWLVEGKERIFSRIFPNAYARIPDGTKKTK